MNFEYGYITIGCWNMHWSEHLPLKQMQTSLDIATYNELGHWYVRRVHALWTYVFILIIAWLSGTNELLQCQYLIQVRVHVDHLQVLLSRTYLSLLHIKTLIMDVPFDMRNPKMISPLGGICCMAITREAVTFPTSAGVHHLHRADKY